jgi:hypothetical protein
VRRERLASLPEHVQHRPSHLAAERVVARRKRLGADLVEIDIGSEKHFSGKRQRLG